MRRQRTGHGTALTMGTGKTSFTRMRITQIAIDCKWKRHRTIVIIIIVVISAVFFPHAVPLSLARNWYGLARRLTYLNLHVSELKNTLARTAAHTHTLGPNRMHCSHERITYTHCELTVIMGTLNKRTFVLRFHSHWLMLVRRTWEFPSMCACTYSERWCENDEFQIIRINKM